MDALEALIERVSCPVLQEPGPSAEQLELMFKAALRAPDHGALRPWRFLVIEGEARAKLGELYLQAALKADPELPQPRRDKLLNAPLRAPTLVVVIAVTQPHPKVPVLEQQVAAGCAAHAMLLAAHAQGIGAMWRTGELAYDAEVLAGLGLAENEGVIGYLYLGTAPKTRKAPQLAVEDYVSHWTGV